MLNLYEYEKNFVFEEKCIFKAHERKSVSTYKELSDLTLF